MDIETERRCDINTFKKGLEKIENCLKEINSKRKVSTWADIAKAVEKGEDVEVEGLWREILEKH